MAIRNIGYYAMPIIPSFEGIESKANATLGRALGASGTKAGREFTSKAAQAIARDHKIEQATDQKGKAADNLAKAMDRAADAAGRVRTAEAQLNSARSSGNESRIVAAEERLATARRKVATETRNVTSATSQLESATRRVDDAVKSGTSGGGGGGDGGMGLGSVGVMMFGARGLGGFGAMGRMAGTAAAGGIAGVLTAAAGAAVIAPFMAGMKAAFDVGLPLERNLNTLQGVTNASKTEMAAAGNEARRLGSDVNLAGVTAGDAAKAMTELAKGGLSVKDAMTAARGTVELATAGQLDAGEAAKYQTAALNMFSLSADKAGHVADLLAQAANASSAEVNDIAMALQQGGSVAAGFGLSIEETLTALTAFSKMGINSSDAGTMLKTSLLAITDQGKPAQEAIADLGLTLYDTNGKFVGYTEMMRQVAEASNHMTQEQFQAATAVLFGSDAMRTAMIAGNKGPKLFNDVAREMANVDGAAGRMAGSQMQGLPGVLEGLSNAADGIKLSVYDASNAIAVGLGQQALGGLSGLGDWIQAHQPQMIGFFTMLGTQTVSSIRVITESLSQGAYALGDFVNIIGDTLGGIQKGYAWSQRLLGRTEEADKADKMAESMFGWGDSLKHLGDTLHGASESMHDFQNKLQAAGDQANDAAKLQVALGQAVADLPDGKTITIDSNDPAVKDRLTKLGFQVEQLPDGKIAITATTDEASRIANAWRQQQGAQPVTVDITPAIDPAKAKAEFDRVFGPIIKGAPPGPPPTVSAPPGGNALNPGFFLPGAPRAAGGLFAGMIPLAAFASGGLPSSATIQAPVGRSGLVQWAEPSTKGEAFIPLGGGERSKSIWLETGKRIGAIKSFEQGGLGDAGGLLPFSQQLRQYLMAAFPQISDVGGYRAPDGYNEHSSGRALDVMIPGWQSEAGVALGNQVASWALGFPGVDRIMWRQRIVYTNGRNEPVADRGSPTQNHMDHVHIFIGDQAARSGGFNASMLGAAGGAPVPDWDAIAQGESGGNWQANTGNGYFGGLQFTQSTWDANKPAGAPARADMASRDVQIAAAENVLRTQGPGAWPNTFTTKPGGGISAYGYGTGAGSPGGSSIAGYEPADPKQVREAQQRVADADQRVAEAEARVRQEEAQQKELKADAKESQRIAAQNQLDKARADVDKARREAADARTDLTETQRGKPIQGKGRTGADSQFGEVGSIASQFLKDTFGLGSILPDPSQLGILQFINALLGVKFGGAGGAGGAGGGAMFGGGGLGDGGTGIDVLGGGGGLPFGMLPGVSSLLPNLGDQPAIPGAHIGTGAAPGPVDQSTHLTINNPQGDEQSIAARTRRVIMRTPRLGTYAPPGVG